MIVPPVPAPPRRLKRARTAVAPVFDPVAEEPQPRQRGRLAEGLETEAVDFSVFASTASSSPSEVPAIETAIPEHEEDGSQDSSLPPPLKKQSASEEELEESPMPARQAAGSASLFSPAAEKLAQDLSAIRRFAALQAIMSVVIAVVLVAILLTLLGIIPKK
jgi:hypothetical protein